LDSPSSPRVRGILPAAVILAAILALSIVGMRPPAPKPATAPAAEFSAVRALETLHRVLKDDAPHPIGSAANERVRGRIVDELTSLGYQPQVQTAFACAHYVNCATVSNVVARITGTEGDADSAGAVLLSAHYDSVPAGPGDSDDGTGVAAVLEIARALKSFPPPRHSIILLIDDGEEAGLLGGQAFVDSSPWAKNVRAAVNLDARGTSGQSLMFETGTANDWVIRLWAQHAAHPAATSIAYAIYKHLPNDTDFTVFKTAGYQGLNFAFIGGVVHYHTPLDNSANVHLGSLQHHGENALPAIVALSNSDLTNLPQQEAVFFDLFGHWLVHWQARRTLAFALAAAILLLLQIAWMIRGSRLTVREYLWGMIAWLVTMVVTGLLAFIVERLLHLAGGTPVNWVAYPSPIEIAFWSLAIAVVTTHAILFARRAGFWGLWAGVWTWWALLAVIVSWQMPALSYVLVVPAGVAALAGIPATIPRVGTMIRGGVAALLPLAAAAIVGFTPGLLLYVALGSPGLVFIALLIGLLFTPIAPICVDVRTAPGFRGLAIPWLPILATALSLFLAVVVPPYSAKAPERVNFLFFQDADTGNAQWVVQPDSGRLPEPIRLAAAFHNADHGAFPWDTRPAFFADAPHLELPPPTFTILESSQSEGRRNYRALLRSERGAPFAAVFFPPGGGVESVRIADQPVPPATQAVRNFFNGWSVFACPAMPAGGIEMSFSVPLGKTVEVLAADQSYGLPPDGKFLLNSRPFTATPSQNGDVTVVSRRVQLLP
jgi:Peptidase family M28